MPKPEPDKLWEGQVNVDPKPVPSPLSLPGTALQAPNRDLAYLGRSRRCEYFFGMRNHHGCNCGDQCCVAHRLSELDVPNETSNDRWANVWHDGEVDIWFWNPKLRSADSKRRFQRAFAYGRGHSETMVPNWAWGVAVYSSILPHESVPLHVPPDYDWPRLKEAWRDGLRHAAGTRFAVRQVLLSPGIRDTGSASSSAAAPSAQRNPNKIRS